MRVARKWLIASGWVLVFVLGMGFFVLSELLWFIDVTKANALRAKNTQPENYVQVNRDPEAVVVLTGDNGRIAAAVELLRLRRSQLLIVSGTNPDVSLRDLANQQGIRFEALKEVWRKILMDPVPGSTRENAIETRKILQTHGIGRVLLVTSDYHMWRAHQTFLFLAPEFQYETFPTLSDVGRVVIEKTEFRIVSDWLFSWEAAKTLGWKWGYSYFARVR